MNASTLGLPSQLRALLLRDGLLSARALQTATGKSQPSISMALAALGDEVHKLGAARSTRYALAQSILGLPARQSIRLDGPHPDQGTFGSLTMLHGNRVHVRGPRQQQWLADAALPWWLSPLQAQGFLGRQFARLRPDFSPDPEHWSLLQTLYMAANHLSDPPGAFSLGAANLQTGSHDTLAANDGVGFDRLAERASDALPAGSSAGGEQPKFIARVDGLPVIVKFTPPRGTPFGERWHDLLHLEHLALEVLQEHGVASAQTTLVHTPRRTYLLSLRFDRIGATGKRHVVAASALHDTFVRGSRRHWVASAQSLCTQGMLTHTQVRTIASIYLFGQYIGNTDMHFGNLSFFVDDVSRPILVPTPVYDMLPMLWRPGVHGGELDAGPVQPMLQPAGFEAQAAQARAWATTYWQRAAGLPALSAGLRASSAMNADRLRQ